MGMNQMTVHTITDSEKTLLFRRMKNGVAKFVFWSASHDEPRTAYGTMDPAVIDANSTPSAKKRSGGASAGTISYFDMQRMAFRSFREDSFMGIVDYGTN